ncbi:hypothetical protein HPB52_004071 [Rhipicephalus sanguineus]|uniref:Uncharacterized protein n=1 Tax=Rhipicephalus sanguineus TaxID=34632 RepID=A0A9D4PUE7_RHISA|nr:hypothetical protein HPB52_004071 [Rhipicephalus sanguineus]
MWAETPPTSHPAFPPTLLGRGGLLLQRHRASGVPHKHCGHDGPPESSGQGERAEAGPQRPTHPME